MAAGDAYADSGMGNNDPDWAREDPTPVDKPMNAASLETERAPKIIKKQGSVTETEHSVSVDKRTCCGYTTERWKKFSCIWFWLIVVCVIGGALISLGAGTLMPGIFMLFGGLVALGCSGYCFKNCCAGT